MVAITINNLTKQFDVGGRKIEAVDSIDAEIDDGSLTTIVGPSGCGKTTLLRMIAGLETPTEGEIFFGEKEVTGVRPQDRNISMVFQDIALFPFKSVANNILYGLKYTDIASDEKQTRVTEMSEMLGISDLLDKKPNQLSGGQQQRVALARSLVRDPDVFLLDEPMSSLDEQIRMRLRSEFKELHRQVKKTTLYVTHNQEQAMTLSDDIIVMNEGKIEQQASPTQVYNSPASLFVATFIGSPTINTLRGRLTSNGVTCESLRRPIELDSVSTAGVDSAGDVVIGIRPEALSLVERDDGMLSGSINIIEQMGNKDVLHVAIGPDRESFRVATQSNSELREDDACSVTFDPEDVYLFDADSGEVITHSHTVPT